ncbi:MATE family efflux transporter [Corynebacterium sphenisci]|uniref:MATE family efflux transporter n=1 Tax=Corynebacterium sphenisci TaxID=191493 RepID=UPI000951580F|nr:MATE family efflux transporter [Corynebacterium sphenisci]
MSAAAPGAAAVPEATAGRILSLALPALGVLAAAPLYLLLDTAVVGRLGATELAALAAGSTILAMVTTQLTFLAYGTTARASRAFGRGDRPAAVAEGVQATWVALLVGLVLLAVIQAFAGVFTRWLAPVGSVAAEAATWLRVASLGIPLTLLTQAGNGWLRGVQDTRRPLLFVLAGVLPAAASVAPMVSRLGLVGSAWSNVLGQTLTSTCFAVMLLRTVRAEGVSAAPRARLIRRQLVLGRDLILRSLSFQVAFLSAAGVAGRFGEAALGGHQVLLQLWNFMSLVLDSLAIAAQTLVGAALGSGSVALARRTGRRVIAWSLGFAGVLAAVFGLGHRVLPALFTDVPAVLAELAAGPWWLLVAMIPIGGLVFAVDGVLLGAGDSRYLRNISIAAVVLGFLPPVWLSAFFGWGLTGVWWGLVCFLLIRMVAVGLRFRGARWARTGAPD